MAGTARNAALWLTSRLVDMTSVTDLDEPRSLVRAAPGPVTGAPHVAQNFALGTTGE